MLIGNNTNFFLNMYIKFVGQDVAWQLSICFIHKRLITSFAFKELLVSFDIFIS